MKSQTQFFMFFLLFFSSLSFSNELSQNGLWEFQSGIALERMSSTAKKFSVDKELTVYNDLFSQCKLENNGKTCAVANMLCSPTYKLSCDSEKKLSQKSKMILTGKKPRVCKNHENKFFYGNQNSLFQTYAGYYDYENNPATCFIFQEIIYVDEQGEPQIGFIN